MANLFMRFPGGKAKAFTMSYDDGVEQDIRLIGIMERFGLKGTFNLNSGMFAPEGTVFPKGQIHRRMTAERAIRLYRESGNEIAVHGVTHPFLEQLPSGSMLYEVLEDRRRLEELSGCIVRGMAYPYGTLSDEVVEGLKMAGIVYARTVKSTGNFRIDNDWLRLPATCHHNDPRLMELGDRFLQSEEAREPQLFYLWGHSYEFEMQDNWNVIEEFAEKIGGHPDVWYATNIQIFDYIAAYRRLRFSVDMKLVENPTAMDIFFELDGVDRVVPAGQQLRIAP
ncbi:MAG: polysaccharide deacetylase family protein [Firmicutes bacterium]|nr:polysaccharide deacetylase family protein [Bacillota bacterium]